MAKKRTRQVQRAEWDEQQFAAHANNQTDEILFEMDEVDSREESDAVIEDAMRSRVIGTRECRYVGGRLVLSFE